MQIVGLYVEDKDYKINITNRNAVNFRTYEVDYRLLIQGVRKNPDNDLMFADFLKISNPDFYIKSSSYDVDNKTSKEFFYFKATIRVKQDGE